MLLFLSRRHFKMQNSLREHDRFILRTAILLLNVVVCISSEPAAKPVSHLGFFCQMCILKVLDFFHCQPRFLLLPSWQQFQQFIIMELTLLNPLALMIQCALFVLQAEGCLCLTSLILVQKGWWKLGQLLLLSVTVVFSHVTSFCIFT